MSTMPRKIRGFVRRFQAVVQQWLAISVAILTYLYFILITLPQQDGDALGTSGLEHWARATDQVWFV